MLETATAAPSGPWRPHPGPQTQALASPALELLFGGGAGGGKALRIDEPIPTPTGWTTMGELRPGDLVLDADGCATRVLWCSPIEEKTNVWEFEFDDGTTIQSDGEHQWVTLDNVERRALLRLTDEWRQRRKSARGGEYLRRAAARAATPGKMGGRGKSKRPELAVLNAARAYVCASPPDPRGTTRTTQQIVDSLRVGKAQRANHCVVNPTPLQLPESALPIDPYLMGAWLGDGTSSGGAIAGLDEEVFASIERAGYTVRRHRNRYSRGVLKLSAQLRALGLLNNKHVPQKYLRASVEQRIALLQGLCDTDGHATAKGSIEFTTTSEQLKDGMLELLASLGIKPSCREGRATLRGRDVSAKWRIQFWTKLPCFRIQRKAVRQKRSGFRGPHDRRYIVRARLVEPTLMRCIAVEAESKTYLAGRHMVVTHNSCILFAGAARYIDNPNFRGIFFRNTFPEVLKVSDQEARPLYEPLGGKFVDMAWRFPSGAKIYLSYLARDSDVYGHQGAAYQYIAFDELTHFTAFQYRYLFSRLRSKHGIVGEIRASCNPEPGWVKERFGAWVDKKHPGPRAESGEIRYVLTSKEGVESFVPRGTPDALGRCFIRSMLINNPSLANTPYAANLKSLDPVQRARLLDGDWDAVYAPGILFKRGMFEVIPAAPAAAVYIRFWDRASTEKKLTGGEGGDPDWTVGTLYAYDGVSFTVVDVVRERFNPAGVFNTIRATAAADRQTYGDAYVIGMSQDPGAAGKFEVAAYQDAFPGFAVEVMIESGDKVTRAGPVSTQAAAGNVRVLEGRWLTEWFNELEAFPSKQVHDDQVDSLSGAHWVATNSPLVQAILAGRPSRRSLGGLLRR